jgi:hypothetical protein
MYRVKNWATFQHYRDRNPPWIKLHFSMLSSQDWVTLDDKARVLAIACMLIASRNEGKIPNDPAYIKRVAYLNTTPDFKPLILCGFLEVDSECKQPLADARPETEAENRDREQRKRTETEENIVKLPDACGTVFEHWKSIHGHGAAKLTADRRKVVVKALQNYSPDELCECISGYKASAWHQGQNERGQVYDALELMLRDAKHIDAGISYARKPAQGRTVADLREAATKNTIEEWANG